MMTRSEELMAKEEAFEVEGTVVILGTRVERVLPGWLLELQDKLPTPPSRVFFCLRGKFIHEG